MNSPVFHALLSFALVAGLITIIPGLDTAVVLRSALVSGRRQAFAAAFGINVGAFYIAIFPQFMPAHVSHLAMGLGLAGVHDIEAMVWFTVLILCAHRARAWFAKRRVKRALDAVTGTVLVGFGVELALRG